MTYGDRPTALELLEAVTEFLAGELAPALDDQRLRFRTLVAANALGIAYRELEAGPTRPSNRLLQGSEGPERGAGRDPAGESSAGDRLLQGIGDPGRDPESLTAEELAELAARIRAGAVPEGAVKLLKAHVAAKLRVSNPRYLEKYE